MKPTELKSGQIWREGDNIFIVISDNDLFRRVWLGDNADELGPGGMCATVTLKRVEVAWEYCGVINWEEFNDFIKDELSRNKGDS